MSIWVVMVVRGGIGALPASYDAIWVGPTKIGQVPERGKGSIEPDVLILMLIQRLRGGERGAGALPARDIGVASAAFMG